MGARVAKSLMQNGNAVGNRRHRDHRTHRTQDAKKKKHDIWWKEQKTKKYEKNLMHRMQKYIES